MRASRSIECDDDGVAVAREADEGVELGAGGVLARGVVGEGAIDGDTVELAIGVLVEGGDADVADALPVHDVPPPLRMLDTRSICQDRVYKVRGQMSRKRKGDPKLTR